jgi:Na+/melibiose symporter-like transporter
MIADICDLDEVKTGRRREGMYGASYSWACKVGVSLTMILSGYRLKWSGFDAEVDVQPEAVIEKETNLCNDRAVFSLPEMEPCNVNPTKTR